MNKKIFFLLSTLALFADYLAASSYKARLESQITAGGFERLSDSSWQDLVDLINDQVLDHATQQSGFVNEHLMSWGLVAKPRTIKDLSRIQKKLEEDKRPERLFKANADFIGFRILVENVDQIGTTLQIIQKGVKDLGGFSALREPILFLDSGLKSISNFIYIYLPKVGYIAEIQVQHPFAGLAFERNSWFHRHPDKKGRAVNLFKGNGFYKAVENHILTLARGEISNFEPLREFETRFQSEIGDEDPDFLAKIIPILEKI